MASSFQSLRVTSAYRQILLGAGLVLLGGIAGWWFFGHNSKPQVVFVRTNEVMARYKVAIRARENFKQETTAWADESKQLETRLREMGKTAKPTDAKALEEARELSSRLKALRDKGAQRDQELTAPVIAEVNAAIKKFAQRKGFRVVLGTMQGGNILYGEDALDVTEALITEMNAQ